MGEVNFMSFPNQSAIYIYLYNKHFTQNLIEGANINAEEIITYCDNYKTNGEIKKDIALDGNALNTNDLAYPCGEIPMYYPQSVFTMRNIDTNQYVDIKMDGLSLTKYSFKNGDLSKQWADV